MTNHEFNHRRLELARQARGLTQAELAASLDISQGRLSKMEKGLCVVDAGLYDKLSTSLGYPPSFFQAPEHLYGMPLRYHRKKQSVPKRELDRVHAQVAIACTHVQRLWENVDIEQEHKLPRLDVDDHDDAVEEIARMVRGAWMLPRGPVDSVVARIEAAGIVVVEIDFGVSGLDAIGMRFPDPIPPVIFVSHSTPGDRMRFSLAHELGHLVMHTVPPENAAEVMEKQADRFAAEFLMPSEDVLPDLRHRRLDVARLGALKEYWRVAMTALLGKAKTLGVVTERQARYLYVQMSSLGYRTREPVKVEREVPSLISEILTTYQEDLEYSAADIAALLALENRELTKLYPIKSDTAQRLRLV